MIIIIDMSKAMDWEDEFPFAVWDTVSDRFLETEHGDQVFSSLEEFTSMAANDKNCRKYIKRVRNLVSTRNQTYLKRSG